jgi:glucose/arabinose dehydrogenase
MKRITHGFGIFALVALAMVASSPAGATELPSGFVEATLLTNDDFQAGVNNLAFAPDGTLFLAAKFGHFWTYDGSTLTFITIIPTSFNQHRGVLGLAVDPDYTTNNRIWFYYTTPAPARNRLAHFTFTGDALIDETVVVDGPLLADSMSHGGGGLEFAEDGTIFLSMGDDEQGSTTSQDPFDLRGSVIHVNQDGPPAAGNPFLDGVAGHPLVYSIGMRQPYRLTIQPGSGNVVIGDVGANGFEELDFALSGANFGWELAEGSNPPGLPGLTYPVHAYVNGGSACIVMGDFAETGDFAPQYEGDLFFGDYSRNEIHRLIFDDSNLPVATEPFATDVVARSVDFEFGPDGALYYLTFTPSELRRISYVSLGNEQPVALATPSVDNGAAPLAVSLDGSASSDPDDDALTYQWDLGDGNFASGVVANHSYAVGEHFASLTVDDGNGGQDTTPMIRIVAGNTRPVPTITSPADESTYDAGTTVTFDGSATDTEDPSVPCGQFSWMVVFHHGGQAGLVQGPNEGSCSGMYDIPLLADTDPNQWYQIRLQVSDSGSPLGVTGKLNGTQSIEIRPNTSVMSFATAPEPDLQLELDGAVFTPPLDVTGVVNQPRAIAALDDQLHANGHTYTWMSWSDGQAIAHGISTPTSNTTYTATFGCDVIVEVSPLAVDKSSGGEIDLSWPVVSDGCLAAGADRYRIYASETAAPASPPGSFPADPAFTLVGGSTTESFSYTPDPGHRFFLVVATGTDGDDGPVGHYGF